MTVCCDEFTNGATEYMLFSYAFYINKSMEDFYTNVS
jgi:hypothetical protein